jgi:hypothetical protein
MLNLQFLDDRFKLRAGMDGSLGLYRFKIKMIELFFLSTRALSLPATFRNLFPRRLSSVVLMRFTLLLATHISLSWSFISFIFAWSTFHSSPFILLRLSKTQHSLDGIQAFFPLLYLFDQRLIVIGWFLCVSIFTKFRGRMPWSSSVFLFFQSRLK